MNGKGLMRRGTKLLIAALISTIAIVCWVFAPRIKFGDSVAAIAQQHAGVMPVDQSVHSSDPTTQNRNGAGLLAVNIASVKIEIYSDTMLEFSHGAGHFISEDGNEEYSLLDYGATGAVRSDGKTSFDQVVILEAQPGGSGTFYSAVAIGHNDHGLVATKPFLLGDRIDIHAVTIDNGIAMIDFLDRASDEPMNAECKVKKQARLVVKGGMLVEVLKGVK
jgi:hypothetical protein